MMRSIFYAIYLTDVVGLDPRLGSFGALVGIFPAGHRCFAAADAPWVGPPAIARPVLSARPNPPTLAA
jgi:hypothetical protein